MAYDKDRATPSSEAHTAAESLDSIIESLVDGLQISDFFTAYAKAPVFITYVFESGISKGESISRMTQVLSLLERDNRVFAGLRLEPSDQSDE